MSSSLRKVATVVAGLAIVVGAGGVAFANMSDLPDSNPLPTRTIDLEPAQELPADLADQPSDPDKDLPTEFNK